MNAALEGSLQKETALWAELKTQRDACAEAARTRPLASVLSRWAALLTPMALCSSLQAPLVLAAVLSMLHNPLAPARGPLATWVSTATDRTLTGTLA